MKNFLLILFLLNSSITAQEVVAHRGAAHRVPENSIAAFKHAWELGADFIEADFYLTTDKQIVCFHDEDTRSLNGPKLHLEKCSWAQLKDLDIGTSKTTRGKGHRMPLLQDVLNTVPKNKGIFIEIKSNKDIAPHLKKVIEQSNVDYAQIHIICFDAEILHKCKTLMPLAKTQWLIKIRSNKLTGSPSPKFKQIAYVLKRLKFDGIGTNVHNSVLTLNNLKNLQKAGFYWNIWTINDPKKVKPLKAYGIDYITTDRPSICK